uniref:Tc1-like transposase DDE domain-containing protein n=1 Tax=Oncorhynchus tshawytscha TaxID=74940 RepID=A0AAZ3RIZ1_ONCTS
MCGSHREAWRRRCDGALLVTLSVIYLEFKAHLTSMATTAFCSDNPSGLGLVGLSFVFQRDNNPHTSRLCKGYLTKKESDGVLHQMTWPPQSLDLNQIEMLWDLLDSRVKEKRPSAQHM